VAPKGQTLTVTLYPRGSDTASVSGVALTERTNQKGVYRGTITPTLSGWYRCSVLSGSTPLVVTDALFDGSATVYAGDAPPTLSIYTPTTPAVTIPAPPSSTQTTAWCYVYDKAGALADGAKITVSIYSVTGTHGAYSSLIGEALSVDGVASLSIPRGAHLKFNVRRGNGLPVQFSGADADTLQMPTVVG
jgi:hypothetical protein